MCSNLPPLNPFCTHKRTPLSELNVAQNLVTEGLSLPHTDSPALTIPACVHMQGLKLSTVTQASVYHAIRTLNSRSQTSRICQQTTRNLELVQSSLQTFNKLHPRQSDIWMSLQHTQPPPKIHNFLYLALHSGLRIGTYWKHIPGYEDRALCPKCQTTKDLTHILLECKCPGQHKVWILTAELWCKKHHSWPMLSIGLLLGCCSAVFPNAMGS